MTIAVHLSQQWLLANGLAFSGSFWWDPRFFFCFVCFSELPLGYETSTYCRNVCLQPGDVFGQSGRRSCSLTLGILR